MNIDVHTAEKFQLVRSYYQLLRSTQDMLHKVEVLYHSEAEKYLATLLKNFCEYTPDKVYKYRGPDASYLVKPSAEGNCIVSHTWNPETEGWDTQVSTFPLDCCNGAQMAAQYFKRVFTEFSDDKTLGAYNILWNVDDGDDSELPKEVTVPLAVLEDKAYTDSDEAIPDRQSEEYWETILDTFADWLSDTYGYCHSGYALK